MKIKLNYVFKTLDGKPIQNQSAELDEKGQEQIKRKDFTFRQACENALLIEPINPQTGRAMKSIDGVEKNRRGGLAYQIHKAGSEIDLSVDDVKLLKDLIAEMGSPLIVYQAWNILDPRDPKETIPKDK